MEEEENIEEEDLPPNKIDPSTLELDDVPYWVQNLVEYETCYNSPINLDVTYTTPLQMPHLTWHHFEVKPRKMKISNTGYTLTISAKFHNERPYITYAPSMGEYVFSQIHFHWGRNDAEGSEHTVDGIKYPMEMHVVFYKRSYLTQESALKEKDGIIIAAYLGKLQGGINYGIDTILKSLSIVQEPHVSMRIEPIPLTSFIQRFEVDYLLYWGAITTSVCLHYVLWLVSREPFGISREQTEEFRSLLDVNDEPLQSNFRELEPSYGRRVFHVCPSNNKNATLLPLR